MINWIHYVELGCPVLKSVPPSTGKRLDDLNNSVCEAIKLVILTLPQGWLRSKGRS